MARYWLVGWLLLVVVLQIRGSIVQLMAPFGSGDMDVQASRG